MKDIVLIADDDEICRATSAAILQEFYEVQEAASGEETLAMVREFHPQLLLLDIGMPDMDGFAVFEALSESGENLPIIFVTGQGEAEIEIKGLEQGAVDFVTKPVNPAILLARVNNQLEMARYRSELEDMVEQRTAAIRETLNTVIVGMACLAECSDAQTGQHLQRVKGYSRILGEELVKNRASGLTLEDVALISDLSPVHDIGKVGISDDILLKPAALTGEEFAVMRKHTVYGGETLLRIRSFLESSQKCLIAGTPQMAVGELRGPQRHTRKSDDWFSYCNRFLCTAYDIACGHHEHWDGSGYPYKLAGADIPWAARIVSLADVYDALTSARPYKKAFSHSKAVEIITVGDGRTCPEHFDPQVIEAFIKAAPRFEQLAAEINKL